MVLKQGLQNEHIDKHIDWVNDMHKGKLNGRGNKDEAEGIKHTYRSESIGFHGYAGKFSDGVLRKIQGHEHVGVTLAINIHTKPFEADIFSYRLTS